MNWIHYITAVAFVVAILAQPLRGETWIVLAKPSMEVIGTFELEEGGMVNVDVDTREQCLKLFKITESVPTDLEQVITTKESREVIEGKSVPVVTVSIDKAKIKVGFKDQKYRYDLKRKEFKVKRVEVKWPL